MLRILLFLILGLFIMGCNGLYNDAPIVSFVEIDSLVYTPTVQADIAFQQPRDVFVFINGTTEGVFRVSGPIPIPTSGRVKLTIRPNVIADGQVNSRPLFLFWKPIELDTIIPQNSVLKLGTLNVAIDPNYIVLSESFVNPLFPYSAKSLSSRLVQATDPTAKPTTDKQVAKLIVGSLDSFAVDIESNQFFTIPTNNATTFLEVSIRSAGYVAVGILNSNGDRYSDLTINPTDTWTKLYINLTEEINSDRDAKQQKIFFRYYVNANADNFFMIDDLRLLSLGR